MRATGFLVLFGVFWSGMTLLVDSFTVVPAVRQLAALRYPSTEGTVLSSEMIEQESDDGTTYNIKIRYSYSVGSREFECQRYRYQTLSSKRAHADNLVRT